MIHVRGAERTSSLPYTNNNFMMDSSGIPDLENSSRRKILAVAGTTIGTTIAGCISFGSGPDEKFRLVSNDIRGVTQGPRSRPYLIDPLDIDSKYSIELSDAYKRAKIEELVETGTVSTRAWELSYQTDWGPIERDNRCCIEYDGTYYRVRVESREEVKRGRWVFYLDWNDQNPSDDDEVITLGDNSLSDQDQEVLRTAWEEIPSPDLRRMDERSLTEFTVVFHEELHPDESELVPNPSSDYIEHNGEHFRAVTEYGSVERPEQTFSIEPVADSFEQYQVYAKETFPDARFSNVDLSADATEILETAIDIDEGFAYEEKPPLSDALEEVLDHLTITEYLEPHDSYDDVTWFNDALAEYRHRWYEFTLIIYPEDYETY